jgi:hypothetical protein
LAGSFCEARNTSADCRFLVGENTAVETAGDFPATSGFISLSLDIDCDGRSIIDDNNRAISASGSNDLAIFVPEIILCIGD